MNSILFQTVLLSFLLYWTFFCKPTKKNIFKTVKTSEFYFSKNILAVQSRKSQSTAWTRRMVSKAQKYKVNLSLSELSETVRLKCPVRCKLARQTVSYGTGLSSHSQQTTYKYSDMIMQMSKTSCSRAYVSILRRFRRHVADGRRA